MIVTIKTRHRYDGLDIFDQSSMLWLAHGNGLLVGSVGPVKAYNSNGLWLRRPDEVAGAKSRSSQGPPGHFCAPEDLQRGRQHRHDYGLCAMDNIGDKMKSSQTEKISLGDLLRSKLMEKGADFVFFVDISGLPRNQTRDFSKAILIGIALSKDFIKKVTNTTDYVKNMILKNDFSEDEFLQKETKADRLADYIADYLTSNGYPSYSQSENRNITAGIFDENTKSSILPHKTIAGFAGLGWIGKHNLLVTQKFGSAICMCTVLTEAPLKTVLCNPESPRCGDCNICQDICSVKAIKGNTWRVNISRDELVDVYKCTTCLECLVFCPWTQKYMNANMFTKIT